ESPRGPCRVEPRRCLFKYGLPAIILNQLAGEFIVQIDVECFGHGQDSLVATGGVRVMRIPKVCTTVSALPISQVGFPFSSSITKRRPVPEARAKSFCVTLSFLRVS